MSCLSSPTYNSWRRPIPAAHSGSLDRDVHLSAPVPSELTMESASHTHTHTYVRARGELNCPPSPYSVVYRHST